MRFGSKLAALGLVVVWGVSLIPARPASAQEVNCANEFRSAKLYFSQKLYEKAVGHFAVSVKACPDKAEYRARYAIALAQLGEQKLETVVATGDVEGNQAVVDTAVGMYRLAGSEFDASLNADKSKQNVKFVNENRKHFWVDHYNQGIKLLTEDKPAAAELEFRLARLVDPSDVKAYKQGAVSLIKQGKKSEAAALLREVLEKIAPGDSSSTVMLNNIGVDEAQELVKKSEEAPDRAQGARFAAQAESLYSKSIEANGTDANLFFDRGLARLALGSAIAGTDSVISPQAVEVFRKAAADFHKAKEITPAAQDSSFYTSSLYNEIQASMNAEDVDQAVTLLKEYMGFDCKDGGIWKSYAQALYLKGDQTAGAVALIISNSISKGNEVTIADAVKNAREDAAQALTERGQPDHVFAYTEDMGGKKMSIETWIWCGKRKAAVFYLGKNNGEVGW